MIKEKVDIEEKEKENVNIKIEEKKEEELKSNELLKEKDVQEQKEEKDKEEIPGEIQEPLNQENNEKEQEKNGSESFDDFLAKNDSLIKVININLESNGFSKLDIQTKIEEFFQTITESKLEHSHIKSISNLLIELLSASLESDKKDIEQFFNELFSLFEFDKEKIKEQIFKFSEDIEDQEKLKTKKMNRNIRSYIRDCQDKLNIIFKQDDMPSDRIVSFNKFNEIAEEVGLKLKKEYLDVLLYQMKIAVTKKRSIYDFNMIVIVDFLK
jgi:hypothetical protein